jgi:hypothetical protein
MRSRESRGVMKDGRREYRGGARREERGDMRRVELLRSVRPVERVCPNNLSTYAT